jgi:diadenosine tetraphosphatase ApaH/serine/threonine PP2A family protein phosphatase
MDTSPPSTPRSRKLVYNRKAIREPVRILLISDIHANLEGLDACLAAAPAYDRIINLGDIVGYGASPNEVVDRCRQLGGLFVRGNHDKAVSGLSDLEDFNPIAAEAALWTRQTLTPENLEWLRSLPHGPVHTDEVADAQFVHGSPLDEDEYVVSPRDAVESLLQSPLTLTFFGHTHLQGSFTLDPEQIESRHPEYKTIGQSETVNFPLRDGLRYMINPGSIGQPRDGDWRAAFALLDTGAKAITFCRTPYDLKSAQDRILDAGLPKRLATRLAAGK